MLEELLALEPNPDPVAYRFNYSSDLSGEQLRDLHRRFQEDEAACEAQPEVVRPRLKLHSLEASIEQEIGDLLMVGPRCSLDGEECRARYPELVETFDVLEAAENQGVPPHILATWRAGRPLTASEWIGLTVEALENAGDAADRLSKELAAYHETAECAEVEAPCYRALLARIDQSADFLERARAIIEAREPEPSTFSADLCAIASGEFDGGHARARKNVARDEGVEFDDFLDALRESIEGGSTMDLGKLAQAAHKTIAQFDAECIALMRRV